MTSIKQSLQREIIRAIKETPAVSLDTLAKNLKKNRVTILRNMDRLRKSGVLKRVGADKDGVWQVALKNPDTGHSDYWAR